MRRWRLSKANGSSPLIQPIARGGRASSERLADVAEAGAEAGAEPLVAGGGQRVDAAALHVHREGPDRLAAAHHQVASALEAAERVEVLPAAVRELHVADRDRGRARRLALRERLEPQDALDRRHEAHQDPAVDPGQGDRRELELVGEHRPVALEQVGDQVDAGRGVGDEGDLVRLAPRRSGPPSGAPPRASRARRPSGGRRPPRARGRRR